MALINPLLGSNLASTGFDSTLIGNSVWLDGSADGLTAPSSTFSAQDGKEFTLGTWFQLTEFGVSGALFCAGANPYTSLRHDGDNKIYFQTEAGSHILNTTAVFRDVGWYNIIVSVDTTQSTNTNRVKIFINGVEATLSGTYPAENHAYDFNTAVVHEVGDSFENGAFEGYLAQSFMIGSKSIQQGDFAITDFLNTFTFGANGSQFTPKKHSEIKTLVDGGSSNSFLLQYENSSALGTDSSTNTNTFTATSMGSVNQTINTPSKVYPKVSNIGIPSGDTAANYTMGKGSNRMVYSGSNQTYKGLISTQIIQPDDPAIYWELYLESGSVSGDGGRVSVGLAAPDFNVGNGSGFAGAGGNNPSIARTTINDNGSVGSVASKVLAGGVQNLAYEPSTGKIWFGVNGTWNNGSAAASTTLNTASHDHQTTPQDFVFFLAAARSTDIGVLNFGDNPTFSGNETAGTNTDANGHGLFKYAVPSGFLAPVSANLTAPTHFGIDHFNSVKYAGNGTAIGSGGKAVTNVGFSPSWVWIKNRDASDSHALYDVVRGTTKQIETDTTAIETTEAEGLSTFGSDGFTLGSLAAVNTSSEDYISWNWEANTAFSNDASATGIGTLDSSGRVSAADHFSIVSWTGNTTAGATVKHGMSGTPEFIIAIARDASGENKPIFHVDAVTSDTRHIKINQASMSTAGTTIWDVSAMSSTVFGLGAANQSNSANGMIAYCFRSVPGVCKVGSYIGNGNSSDGPFVSTGFLPRWILIKNYSANQNWLMWDTARSPYNQLNNNLFADLDSGESTSSTYGRDILASGFKLRGSSHAIVNASGNSYLYVCMAELGGNGTLPPLYGR